MSLDSAKGAVWSDLMARIDEQLAADSPRSTDDGLLLTISVDTSAFDTALAGAIEAMDRFSLHFT